MNCLPLQLPDNNRVMDSFAYLLQKHGGAETAGAAAAGGKDGGAAAV